MLRGIAREVVAAVEPLGFYCDRRQFRSRIPIATINDRTSVEHLEVMLGALEAYASEVWTSTSSPSCSAASGSIRRFRSEPDGRAVAERVPKVRVCVLFSHAGLRAANVD